MQARKGYDYFMRKIHIKEREAGQRLDKYLRKYLPRSTSGFLYKMLRKKNITLNGKKASGSEMLRTEDEVILFLSEETIIKFGGVISEDGKNILSENIRWKISQQERLIEKQYHPYQEAYETYGQLEIIFENRHVLVVNKPSGLLTQKASPEDLSLNEWLIGYLLAKGEISREELHTFKPSVCNRLDRNTSGLVLCGKTLSGSQKISGLLKSRNLRKFYCLFVKGVVTEGAGIDGYLSKDSRTNRVKLCKEAGDENTSYIKTIYQPIKNYRNITLLEAELVTGKTHQIRIHLAGIGHPVLGDYKYGYLEFNDRYKKKYGIQSQLLHACRLEFPTLEKEWEDMSELVLTAKPPEIFQRLDEEEER